MKQNCFNTHKMLTGYYKFEFQAELKWIKVCLGFVICYIILKVTEVYYYYELLV